MCMSDSSRDYDSNGSHKSLKDRLQSKQSFDADGIKRGLKNVGSTLQSMFSPKADSSVYSKGVRELDNYGYEKYNIEDDGEIFISKVPEKALFNDGEPILVRATGGNFVGSSDNTSVHFDVGEAQAKAEDFRSLFSNVPRGTAVETEYHATVGEVTDEGTVKPRPIDRTFLDRMKASAPNERAVQHVEFEEEAPEEVPVAESPMFLQIDDEEDAPAVEIPDIVADVPEEVPVEEVAAEAEEPVSYSFLDRVAGSQKKTEFFVDDVDEPVVEEAAVESEEDEYSWITFEEDSEESASDIVEAVEETPVTEDIPEVGAISFDEEVMDAEESVFEAPEDIEPFVSEEVSEEQVEATAEVSVMDEPVVEELDFEEPAMEIAEAPVETSEVEDIVEAEEVSAIEAVEEAAVEETEVCAPVEASEVEEPTEATEVTEEVVIDAPVEPIAAMSLPGSIEVEPIAGIEVEGAQPSSDSAIADTVSVNEEVQAAVTSAEAESAPAATPRFNGLEEDGEGLPKLSDPVIRRPRTVRFRFSNGVLQNVESNEKSEPKEELRDPLA